MFGWIKRKVLKWVRPELEKLESDLRETINSYQEDLYKVRSIAKDLKNSRETMPCGHMRMFSKSNWCHACKATLGLSERLGQLEIAARKIGAKI